MPKVSPVLKTYGSVNIPVKFLARAALFSLLLAVSLRAQVPQVMEIPLEGMIHPISAEYVTAGMDQAIGQRFNLILIQLSTPGGLDTSMRQIIEKIIASPVPVVVYVAPSGSRAASAGFFISLSADVAAMAPGTNTGAAPPAFFGGGPGGSE